MATLSLTYRYRTHVIAENEYSTGDPGGNPGTFRWLSPRTKTEQ